MNNYSSKSLIFCFCTRIIYNEKVNIEARANTHPVKFRLLLPERLKTATPIIDNNVDKNKETENFSLKSHVINNPTSTG